MAFRPSVTRISLTDTCEGNFRIRRSDRESLEKHLFQRYPDREWGTFFRFGWRRTSWGVAAFYVDGLWPLAGDLDRQSDLTIFRDPYTLRAFKEAEKVKPLGIGVIHSHPSGFGTTPSLLDDDMDTYFAKEFAARSGGAPYCSLIFQRSDASGLTFSGRIFDRGEWFQVKVMFTVDSHTERHSSQLLRDPDGCSGELDSTTVRLTSVLGDASARRLRGGTIGFVGCSGTGSPAAHVLARAKAGEFVLVDPQRADSSNMERLHGLYGRHLKLPELPYKCELVRDLIREVNPTARITGLAGNILHDNVLDELLRCDMVLGCTDTVHARLAASDFSEHYLLPFLDVGIAMDGCDGRVTQQLVGLTEYSPGLPCALCVKTIDMGELAYELMPESEKAMRREQAREAAERGGNPDHYWRGGERQLHTVGYLTTVAGALAAGYAEGMLTGTFTLPHSSFQFDIGKGRLGCVAPPRTREESCTCGTRMGWGDAGRPYRNVGLPEHFGRRALLLFRD